MNDEDSAAANRVQGERDASSVTRALSVQSRVSNLLAIGLMSVLGIGSLTWYYANAMMRQGRARQSAQNASTNRAQGDMPLPSLGRIDPPAFAVEAPPPPDLDQQQSPLRAATLAEIPLANPATGNGLPPPKSASQLALERALSGAVFAAQNVPMADGATPTTTSTLAMPPSLVTSPTLTTPPMASRIGASSASAAEETAPGDLIPRLRPSATPAARAQVLPAQRLLLPKGAFIDCTLETAIDSTLPGMITCVMATDAFGVDGKVVLLERGTKLIGETRGQVQQGAARVFVLWNEARTPTGVVVPLASPGADELGRAGLPGEVERHFWQRFGAAMLVSVIDGVIQTAVQSSRGGSGTVIVNPSTSQDVLTEVLKGTINIPPTVIKQNGDRIQVLVARDLDFRSVYELRSAAER
jgi:type IV secretion system protein VirB10